MRQRRQTHPCAAVLVAAALGGAARAECIDPAEQARLVGARRLSGSSLEFPQAGRHELSVLGGWYVSDTYDGTFVVGGAYTYHVSEALALEASGGYSQLRSSLAQSVGRERGVTLTPASPRVLYALAGPVWSPLHGKGLLMADTILHFSLYGGLAAGIVDSAVSTGGAVAATLGMKVFLSPAWALRLEVRDHLYQARLLDSTSIVQDFSLTVGVSLFLPFGEAGQP